MDYNLLKKEWIPVIYRTGDNRRVGVIQAFKQAGEIRQMVLASPLDLFAVHRFILALLYWKANLAGGVGQVREALLKTGKVPDGLLYGIEEEQRHFDLFDETFPFLQDPTVRTEKRSELKSAGSLFAELATGTNIAHFHHGDDETLRLCLPCTALGMLRVVPWSQSGGRGVTPSIHNAPPIMALAVGDSLAATLGLNLVPLGAEAGEAKWSGHFTPTNPADAVTSLEALTWNPRRIHLSRPQIGTCWYCGEEGVGTVGPKIVYGKNDATKARKKGAASIPFIWSDPAAFYGKEPFRPVASAEETRAVDGNDLESLINSKSIVVCENKDHQGWQLVIPCTDRRAKTFDHRLLESPSLAPEVIQTLIPAMRRPPKLSGPDGWSAPKPGAPKGIKFFLQAAVGLLTLGDWATLSDAAYRNMSDAPAAFDVFAGLYWGLRNRKIGQLPSRNVAWLMLKVMAASPVRARVIHPGATFCPLDLIPRRQPKPTSHYPLSFPLGDRLEDALRSALHCNFRKREPEPVDWVRLGDGLNQLLD